MEAASRKVVTNRVSFMDSVLRTIAIIYRSVGGGRHRRLDAHEFLDLPHHLRHRRHQRKDQKIRVDRDQDGTSVDREVLFQAPVENAANLRANLAYRLG